MAVEFGFFPDKDKRAAASAHQAKVPLLPEEQLLRVYHQTSHTLMKPLSILALVVVIPAIPLIRYGVFGEYFWLYFLIVIGFVVYAVRQIVIWNLNTYIITDHRLIRILHESLFKKVVVETPLDRILNVSYKTDGIRSVMLGYGDVEVQVVGLIEPIVLKSIAEPAEIKDYLWRAHTEFSKKHRSPVPENIETIQQQIGYTKQNQRIL